MISVQKEIEKCFKCGLCRAVCPVLEAESVEIVSPRAKVALCEAVEAGRIGFSKTTLDILEKCTGCQACGVNCPSGTDPYALTALVRFESGGVKSALPEPTGPVSSLLLQVLSNPQKNLDGLDRRTPYGSARVGYFVGCVEANSLRAVPQNVLTILERLGITVGVPEDQVCCGWPHILVGRLDSARKLALRNKKAFEGFDVVLASCPHCVTTLSREYASLLGVGTFANIVKDVLRFLVEKDLDRLLTLEGNSSRTLYSHPCRMGRGRDKDMTHILFLRKHLGKSLIELDAELCCGAPLELVSPVLGRSVFEMKTNRMPRSSGVVVRSGCPFCVLAIGSGFDTPAKHVMEDIRVAT